MKFKYNFIISATILMLLTGTHFFATSECVPYVEESNTITPQRQLAQQIYKIKKTMRDRDLIYADYELEYESYSHDYLLSIIKSGQNITELDNYEKIRKFVIRSRPYFPKLPNNINKIPKYFFAKCFPRLPQEYCIPSRVKVIERGAFFKNKFISKVIIPGNVETIEQGAFLYCNHLEEVEFAEGLKSIGDRAFEYCIPLEKVEIPSSVESIGNDAFNNCPRIKQVILKEGIKSIGNYAFDSDKIDEIIIPSTIERLGVCPWHCKKIILMDGAERVLRDMTSSSCELEEIELPDSIKYIDDDAFRGLKKLKSIDFPKNLLSIGEICFKECLSLKEVDIPNSVIEIGKEAFSSCDNLEKVKIPKRFEERLGDIFDNCKNLKEITLYDENEITKSISIEDIKKIFEEYALTKNKIEIQIVKEPQVFSEQDIDDLLKY